MPFQRILVAIDGSPGGQKALETAIELGENRGRLAQRTGGRRAATAVCGHDRRGRRGEAGEGRVLRDACSTGTGASAGGRGRARSRRPSRHAADLIVRYPNQGGFDLVVVGHKGHLLEDYLLRSTADRVAHHASCPVMIVKYRRQGGTSRPWLPRSRRLCPQGDVSGRPPWL